jgi:hypothetical protein
MSRMRWAFLGLLVTGLLGCASDPSDMLQAPLPGGAEAITYLDASYGISPDNPEIGAPHPIRFELGEGEGPFGRDYDYVDVGTKVRILEDAPGPDQDGKRLVTVMVLDDFYAGKTAKVRREKLRLLPAGEAPQGDSSSTILNPAPHTPLGPVLHQRPAPHQSV